MKKLETFLQPDGTYRYAINAPAWVVDREARPHYEKDRFASMEANLKRGDVLFDVGAELGWQSAIYAKFVGPENMVLMERAPEFWPVIKETWELNGYALPLLTYCGFVGHKLSSCSFQQCWPPESKAPVTDIFNRWAAILTSSSGSVVTIDHVVGATGIKPKAVTIDVEGGEVRVLCGMEKTLRDVRPLVWVSIHPFERMLNHGATEADVFEWFDVVGYEHQYLGVDHEMHYFFFPKEKNKDVTIVESPWMTFGKRNMSFEEVFPDYKDSDGMPYTSIWGQR